MLRKLICASLFVLATVLSAVPSGAIIVHHCDYTPDIYDGPVHEHHTNPNCAEPPCAELCSNQDVNTGEGVEGHCDHQTAFWWTDMDCTEFGCQMRGKIDCPGGDKSYNFDCWGADGRAFATRTYAECEAGNGSDTHTCTCDYGCS